MIALVAYVLIICVGLTRGKSLQVSRATKIVFSSKLIINEKTFPVLQALNKYLHSGCKGCIT